MMKALMSKINIMLSRLVCFLLEIYPNSGLERSIEKSQELFERADSTIYIVTGRLDSRFYEADEILKAIDEALRQRDVKIEVLVGPDVDEGTRRIFRLASEGGLSLYQLDHYPKYHFAVVDGRHTRIEEPHGDDLGNEKAYIIFNTISLAKRLEEEFIALRSQATKYHAKVRYSETDG